MDKNAAPLYQYATGVVTRASYFLNLFRQSGGVDDDPNGNLSLNAPPGVNVQAELIKQLNSGATAPSLIGLGFIVALPIILNGPDTTSSLGIVGSAASLPFKLIRDVITGSNPLDEIRSFPSELEASLRSVAAPLMHLPFLLVNQIEVALSVVPTLNMFKKSGAALQNVEEALGDYFFTDGFTTIDGDKISHPQLTDVGSPDLKTLKSLVSQKSGADFVRNAARIPIEAGADVEYDLKSRLAQAQTKVFGAAPTPSQTQKLISWMKGYASNAESITTTAVEGLVLGAGSAQTNSLIGAAAGTAAGTAARKATQHVFLRELGV
jgi:hypothetical protein